MKLTQKIKRLLLSCTVAEKEYCSVRKMAYATNFKTWKYLNIFLAAVFAMFVVITLATPSEPANIIVYISGFIVCSTVCLLFFFVVSEDSVAGQALIYVNVCVMLALGLMLSLDRPTMMAVTFCVLMVIMPMFVIGRPIIMTGVLLLIAVLHIWHALTYKDPVVHQGDMMNTILFFISGVVVSCVNNSQRVKGFLLQKKIEKERDTDLLTGIENKSSLMKSIGEVIAQREQCTMLVLDVDDFKGINDNYGHAVGDEVLIGIGSIVSELTGAGNICGRFGGDEFIVLLRSDDWARAADTAQRLIDSVAAQVHTPNRKETVHLSIGIAPYTGTERDYDDLFRRADAALYQAKNAGKGRYMITT